MIKVFSAALVLGITASYGFTQTVKTPSDSNNSQMAAILERLDKQTMQLEALSREVSRLSMALESEGRTESGAAASAQSTPRPALPVTATTSPTPATLPADAPPGSQMHVVVKGENLTKIAKNYQVSIEEIMKVNKIQDDRKLQIGQNLIIPGKSTGTAASPSPAASASPTP